MGRESKYTEKKIPGPLQVTVEIVGFNNTHRGTWVFAAVPTTIWQTWRCDCLLSSGRKNKKQVDQVSVHGLPPNVGIHDRFRLACAVAVALETELGELVHPIRSSVIMAAEE